MDIRADELTDLNDRLLLEAQRAANRDDWANVLALADEVVKNDPTRVEAMYLIALCMRQTGNEGAAALVLTMASKLEPNRAPIWIELSKCLHERHPMEAYRAALKANSLKPDMPDTLSVLCNVASSIGRHAEAVEWAERCEGRYGVSGEVCHNKSFALMAMGRWAEGWREFKASLGLPNRKKRNYHADKETPRWNPAKHEKAVVVIYGEQGIGDEIMYASMIDKAIEAAEAKGSRIVVECYSRNEGLFRRSFPQATVYGTLHEMYSEWPADEGVTHKIEMGGLGEFFAPEPFRRGAYLEADDAKEHAWDAWMDRAAPVGKQRVGIAWTGGSWESGRGRRSIPFELIAQLTRGQDVTFVNLEYEDRRKDLELTPGVLNPVTATKKGQDMDELAALIANLDLVISVQTSVVDLAGALGVPCWAITDQVPQWRYTGFFGPDTMGFYESVKVYRQKQWGEWAPVVNQIARDLKAWTEARVSQAA
jgi:tetratricopeptide (TPR) repeat protein